MTHRAIFRTAKKRYRHGVALVIMCDLMYVGTIDLVFVSYDLSCNSYKNNNHRLINNTVYTHTNPLLQGISFLHQTSSKNSLPSTYHSLLSIILQMELESQSVESLLSTTSGDNILTVYRFLHVVGLCR